VSLLALPRKWCTDFDRGSETFDSRQAGDSNGSSLRSESQAFLQATPSTCPAFYPSKSVADNQDTPQDVLRAMAEIVHYMQIRSYQRANDAYLRLSIGNSAWPIGVTSIGLHERSADQGISEGVVAHVLNDEVSRKWIQAVKR